MPEPEKVRGGQTVRNSKDRRALDDLFSLIYEELRRLASFARRAEVHATINTTGLVHEAWMKLKDSPELGAKSVPHFKSIAARAMRQVLVDEARRRNARKRGTGEVSFVSSENTTNSLKTRSRKKGAGSLGTDDPPSSFSSAGVAGIPVIRFRSTMHLTRWSLAMESCSRCMRLSKNLPA